FLPGFAADARAEGHLAVLFHTMQQACWARSACPGVDVSLSTSTDGGRKWTRPQRLNAESMKLDWIAASSFGHFLGDYVSTSFVQGVPVPVFSLAAPSDGESFHQAIFARVPPAQ